MLVATISFFLFDEIEEKVARDRHDALMFFFVLDTRPSGSSRFQ